MRLSWKCIEKSHVLDKSGAVRQLVADSDVMRERTDGRVSSNKYDFGTQKWLVIEQQNGRKYLHMAT